MGPAIVRRAKLLVLLAVCAGLAAPPVHAVTLTDDAGFELRVEHPVERVVSLSPHLTELMFSIGAGGRLVGTVRGSDFPPAAVAIARIGDAAGLDFERILAARPQVVLAWGSGNRPVDIARLRELGLPVLVLEARRPRDIARHLQLLGALTGAQAQARAVARDFDELVDALRNRYAARAPVRVLFEIWHRPLFTINGNHIISQVLALCGGRNIFADLPDLAGEVSLEQALVADPQAIVVGTEARDARVEDWQQFSYLAAVRNGNVFTVSADLITRQTPRLAGAAQQLCVDLDKARQPAPE
jgi:iron complex transport system substrate-binding protein